MRGCVRACVHVCVCVCVCVYVCVWGGGLGRGCARRGRGGSVNMITDVLYSVNTYIRFFVKRFAMYYHYKTSSDFRQVGKTSDSPIVDR